MRSATSVAIVGAGFSGSLTALHLLRQAPSIGRVLLVERRAGFGPGLAYGACEPEHLLNVRVGNMSAFPGQPDDLARWLSGQGEPIHPSTFITRETYGRYLTNMIRQAIGDAEGAGRLLLAHDEAVAVNRGPAGPCVQLAMGNVHEVDAVIIATGNLPPAAPPGVGLERLPRAVYTDDPWSADTLERIDPTAPVLLLGTGLTMVDVAISLEARGHQGPITAISRRGLTPRAHGDFAPIPAKGGDPQPMRLSQMVRRVRSRSAEAGWRAAIDALRPETQTIWRRADLATRQRFLRHLRPWWDVHRHRMAPAVAGRIGEMRSSGRLTVLAGRITGTWALDGRARVAWRPRGALADQCLEAARIINCTGPGGGAYEAREPLIRRLLDRGDARLDPLGLGLVVDDECRLIGRNGEPDARLYAVGPITRGSFWESTAVPDIRDQVAAVAAGVAAQLGSGQRRAPPAART